MARKRKVTVETELDPGQAIGDVVPGEILPPQPAAVPVETPLTREECQIADYLDSFGDEPISVKIYQMHPQTGKPMFRTEATSDTVTETWMQSMLGEGKYQVKVVDANGHYKGSKLVTIGPALPGPHSSVAPAPVIPAGTDPVMASLLTGMQKQIDTLTNLTIELAKNSGGSGSTFAEVAQAMASLKAVVQPPAPANPLDMVSSILDIFKKGVEMGATGGGGEKSIWASIAEKAIEILPEVGRNIAARVNGSGEPAAIQANPAAPAADPKALPSVPAELLAKLRQGVAYLKSRCRAGKDPMLYVDLLLDNLDSSDHAVLLARLVDRPIDELKQIDEEIAVMPYRPWFEKFFTELRNAFQERDASGGTGGDSSDASPDGGAGEGEPSIPDPAR